jgi:arsenate reductase (thioredoxin)
MKRVLFVCNHNAGRSQMAEAFLDRHAPDDIRADSAGTAPARRVWPEVVEAMAEVGIDLSRRRPTKLTREMQLRADWAVTMGCGDACPFVPTTVESWDIPDPAGRPIEDVRAIRDGIEARVLDLVDHRIEAIRADRTAHQLRLQALLRQLGDEFCDTREAEDIRRCADAVLSRFADAPVRSYVQTLAYRQTRDCLRRESCDVLAVT